MASIPFMRPPDMNDAYQVGDNVEAFCDHDKGDQRVKGWLKGTVVQIDGKLVAVHKPNHGKMPVRHSYLWIWK